MSLSDLSAKIKQSFTEKLPGFSAQALMSPPIRRQFTLNDVLLKKPKESAVLVLLYEKEGETYIVFTKRHDYKGVHGGQISLPGGKTEAEDADHIATALRETEEEVGIAKQELKVLGSLTWLYVPPSNFIIRPVVAVASGELHFIPEEAEVKEILEIPLATLLDENQKEDMLIERKALNIRFTTPAYRHKEHLVWGATAMIISELIAIIKGNA